MTGLPSTLFAALFSQARRFAHRLLETVGRWGLTTIVAILGCLSFQLLDASIGLFKTFQGFCQGIVQGLIFGYLSFQLLDASVRLFKAFQGFCQVVAQGLIFGSLHFQFFYQFEGVHEATLPNFFLALNPLGLLSSTGRKEAKQLQILELLHTVGMHMSAGQLSDFLIKDQEQFHSESAAVVRAGLRSSRGPHLDSTGTRVDGKNEQCHVLCNPFYTAYCTLPAKDRLSLLRVLMGGADLAFRLNELALSLLKQLGVAQKWCQKLTNLLPHEQDWNENKLDEWLDEHLPKLGAKLRKLIKDGLAIAAYRTQTACPVVELLVCDDAPQCNWLTVELALCWIHEYRHYKKLTPRIPYHRKTLDSFKECFWKLYRQLLAYRQNPNQKEADYLRGEFERLFEQSGDYEQLDERKALTLAKKEHLLMVLSHPEILLHDNPAELGARQRVRKRDVSLQARTREGIEAWDTFQTLVSTAKKLGVNMYQYLYDRIAQTNTFPSLAHLIEERSQDFQLAASWGRGT